MIYTAIDTFYLTEEQLTNSPSRKDAIDEETEITLRIYGCDLIQESGILLRLYPLYLRIAVLVLSAVTFSFFRYNVVSVVLNWWILDLKLLWLLARFCSIDFTARSHLRASMWRLYLFISAGLFCWRVKFCILLILLPALILLLDFNHTDFQRVAASCVWLASKLEESPRKARQVLIVFHRMECRRENLSIEHLDLYSKVWFKLCIFLNFFRAYHFVGYCCMFIYSIVNGVACILDKHLCIYPCRNTSIFVFLSLDWRFLFIF